MLAAGPLWRSFPSAEVGEVEASFVHGMDEDDAAYLPTMLAIAGEVSSGLLGRNVWREMSHPLGDIFLCGRQHHCRYNY